MSKRRQPDAAQIALEEEIGLHAQTAAACDRAYAQRDDNWRRLCAANTRVSELESAMRDIAFATIHCSHGGKVRRILERAALAADTPPGESRIEAALRAAIPIVQSVQGIEATRWLIQVSSLIKPEPADTPLGDRPHLRPDGFPTRSDITLWTDAERAIGNAIAAVEDAGASPALTDAVVLLNQAQERVADHIEGAADTPPGDRCPTCGSDERGTRHMIWFDMGQDGVGHPCSDRWHTPPGDRANKRVNPQVRETTPISEDRASVSARFPGPTLWSGHEDS